MEENQRNEWNSYEMGNGNTPYYEYASSQQRAQQPPQPPLAQPGFPPTFPSLPPQPPKRPRNRGVALIVAIVSVVLVVVVVAMVVFARALFFPQPKPPSTAATAVPTAPAQGSPFQATPTASFRAASCPFQVGDGIIEGKTLTCGYITVPENRSKPGEGTVQLAVAIFKSPTAAHDAFPIVRLEGGPGGASLDNWAHYISSANYNSFVFNHDLIMFDQRGTGYSTPSLKCPETLKLQYDTLNVHLNAADSERLQLQALRACHDRLVSQGIDLNAFNSIENAGDVHDLIVALGYKQATLYGVSYGTRLALTTMRLYPSVIHGVVLDSTYPPQSNRSSLPSSIQRVFNTLFQGCAANANCAAKYPRLDSVFYQLVTTLNANPVRFQTTDSTSNKNYMVDMAGNDFVFVLFSALYVTQFIPALPQMIFQVRDQNYTLLSQIYGAVEFDNTFSDGMFYSDECSEDWDFLKQGDIATAMQGVAPQIQPAVRSELQQEYDDCQLWRVQQAPAAQKQPVVSSIPTLVLSDEYDPITPPANGKQAAQTLKNSYYFLFPGLGHGAEYNSPCVDSIISEFEDNPGQKPSGACIASMGEPNFT